MYKSPSFEKIKDLVAAVHEEESFALGFLNLAANEASMSNVARGLQKTTLADRYFSGAGTKNGFVDFEIFTCRGLPAVDALISAAEAATQDMLGAELVNLKTLSGIHAMTCVLAGATQPGECILTLRPADGGHFATKSMIEQLGRRHEFIPVLPGTVHMDVKKTCELAATVNARVVYLDIMYTLEPPNVTALRNTLPSDVIVVVDASHLIGLILGKAIRSPLADGADIICANTHKTLPGPHKGLIAYQKKMLGEKINERIKSFYSTTHTHHLLSLSVTLLEMLHFGEGYAKAIIENSNALGASLHQLGYNVRRASNAEFTSTHQLHVELGNGDNYVELCRRLIRNKIIVNFTDAIGSNTVIRFGTQDVTRRGMSATDMARIGELVHRSLLGELVETEVSNLLSDNQLVSFSFDEIAGFSKFQSGEIINAF